MAIDPIAVMGAWAEATTEQQAKMLDLVIASVLVRLGQGYIELHPEDLAHVARENTVTRTLQDGKWIIRVSPKPSAGA